MCGPGGIPENIQLIDETDGVVTVDPVALTEALEALATVPFSTNPLEVVLAADVEFSVSKRDPDAPFRESRTGGQVTALTLRHAGTDGQPLVILSAWAFQAPGTPAHWARHEGWHVLLNERGEHGDAVVERAAARGHGGNLVVHMAAELLLEYRVELAACTFHGEFDVHTDRTVDVFVDVEQHLADVVDDLDPAGRAEAEAVLQDDLFDFFNTLAHIAAETHAAADFKHPFDHRLWQKFVGGYWEVLSDLLRPVPSAVDLMAPTDMDAVTEKLAMLLSVWLLEKLEVGTPSLQNDPAPDEGEVVQELESDEEG